MATNIQLELALKEAQKQITALQQEVSTLKSASAVQVAADVRRLEDITRRAFRSAGYGTDWGHAQQDYKKELAALPQENRQ